MARLLTPKVHGGLRLGFDYSYTVNSSKRTATVECSLTPYPYADKPGDPSNATYHFIQGTNTISLNWGNGSTSKSWDKWWGYDNGVPSYRAVCDSGSNYDKKYNCKWMETYNGNGEGYHWWVYMLGTKFYKTSFTVNYNKAGKASFTVNVNFAWFADYPQDPLERQKISQTINLPNIDPYYYITYDANGGTGAPARGIKYKNTVYSIPATVPTWKNNEKTFTHWYIKETGRPAYAGKTITAGSNNDYTLIAQWKKTEIPITYDPNGGFGGPENGKKYYGEQYIVPSEVPVKKGYTFKYWDIKETKYTVEANKPISAGSNRLAGYTLIAHYEPNKYTINLNNHPKISNDTYYSFEQTYDSLISKDDINKFISYKVPGYEFIYDSSGLPIWVTDLTETDREVYKSKVIGDELKAIEKRKFDFKSIYQIDKDIDLYPILKYSTTTYINVDGKWKLAIPYVKDKGEWKQALVYKKVNNEWKL